MDPIQKSIYEALGIDGLPENEQQEIFLRIGAVLYQNILVRAMEMMPEEDQDEFEKILEKGNNQAEILIFLKHKVPDLERIAAEEAVKFKNKSSSIMDQIGN